MKRVNFIFFILIVFQACVIMIGCATTRNIENVLRDQRWSDLDAAIKDYWRFQPDPFGVKQEEMKRDIRSVADFLKQDEACREMEASADINDQQQCYQKAVGKWNDMPKELPFSRSFVDDLNSRKDRIKDRMAVSTLKIHAKEIEEEEQRSKKEEELRAQREKERTWEQEADNLLRDAEEKALETPKYIVRLSERNICSNIADKSRIEQAIKQEKNYSEKYGVVNLSKIDRYKQAIMQIDYLSVENRRNYKKYTGKDFNNARCRNKKIEAYDDELDKLQKEIVLRIVNDELNLIQDRDRRSHMIKYIETKQSFK